LLAGEGNLARIEPREVRDKLRTELDSPNPDVGLFRSYAGCDVWVSIDPSEDLEADEQDMSATNSWEGEFLHEEEQTADSAVALPGARTRARFEIAADPAEDESPRRAAVPEDLHHADGESVPCAFCSADLPADRSVNFCPFCGTDQSQQPCPSCGEVLDPLWRFCAACGARTRTLGDHVN
jgi:hypothetical protein